MGAKGQSTTQTNQSQTYAPAGANYVTNALDRASNVAQTPFNVPQAPVAGFSQDQQNAFGNINAAQGMAQPYINQAANYFTPQGTQAFLNPYAQNVMAGLQNVFGQQATQNTGQLTQAAGGVGADRIAVGQANLANQQGLAAGQTLSGLYNNAAQQAQSAGYGTAALGSQAQNAALTGAQAQLASGGLQQQLQQAQLNAPYQQQVAQSQFPYQQASWLANITGALAPGLGGTTSGFGNSASTPAQPSIWSQILGGGAAGAGILGQTGAFGSNGWLTGGNSYQPQGDTGAWGLANTGASGSAFQGPPAPAGYAEGGVAGDEPIDISAHPFIPQDQIAKIAPTMPQLNLNPPQQSGGGGGGGGGLGDIIGMAAKIVPFLARGGAVNPYARGGRAYADAGVVPDFVDRWDDAFPQIARRDDPPPTRSVTGTGLPGDTPYVDINPADMDKWRRGVDADRAAGVTAQNDEQPAAPTTRSLAYAPPPPSSAPEAPAVQAINKAAGASNPYQPSPPAPQAEEPQAQPAAQPSTPAPASKHNGFIDSPWAALTAAGLGIMGGTSPFAGVNIGQGAQQGLKMLQQQRDTAQKDTTIQQAADRLAQEARFHEDPYNRLTKAQQIEAATPREIGRDNYGRPVRGVLDLKSGKYVDPATQKPIDLSKMGELNEEQIEGQAQAIANYQQPAIPAGKAMSPIGMQIMQRARQIAADQGVPYNQQYYNEAQGVRNKFASGPQGDAVRSFSTAYEHIEVARKLIEAMNTGDTRTANRLGNWLKTELNLSSAPGNAAAANDLVADEITKAVIGAKGALGDREEQKAHIDTAKAKGQLFDLFDKTYKPLMMGQLRSYERQFVSGTHGGKGAEGEFAEKLSPHVRTDLEQMKKADAGEGGGGTNLKPPPPDVLSQAKAAVATKGVEAVRKRLIENGYDASGL